MLKPFSAAAKALVPGDLYEHYKGNRYKIIAVARHSETLEEMVVYSPLATGDVWVRPLEMFLEEIVVDGRTQPRFKKI